jgi:hypothetical protein
LQGRPVFGDEHKSDMPSCDGTRVHDVSPWGDGGLLDVAAPRKRVATASAAESDSDAAECDAHDTDGEETSEDKWRIVAILKERIVLDTRSAQRQYILSHKSVEVDWTWWKPAEKEDEEGMPDDVLKDWRATHPVEKIQFTVSGLTSQRRKEVLADYQASGANCDEWIRAYSEAREKERQGRQKGGRAVKPAKPSKSSNKK